jgi:hypothetical protein
MHGADGKFAVFLAFRNMFADNVNLPNGSVEK